MNAAVMITNRAGGKPVDEAELSRINAARHGDVQAFNELVLSNQDRLYHWVASLVGDPALAEDVTQWTFLTAYQKLHTLQTGAFRPWLYRIARNKSLDEMRRRKRISIVSLDEPAGEQEDLELGEIIAAEEMDLEEIVEQSEQSALISTLLNRLPEPYRLVLILIDMQGLDYQEAAQALGVPIGTVKSRLARARLNFRGLALQNGLG